MNQTGAAKALKCLSVAAVIIYSGSVFGEALSPLNVFKRCYIRLVRQVPVASDALYQAVEKGTKSPALACTELFDRAAFGAGSVLSRRTSLEAKSIVQTLHDLHLSWFQSKIHPYTSSGDLIRDAEEPALYFTRAALNPSTPFSSVVTHNTGLAGVRDQVTYPNELDSFLSQKIFAYPPGYPFSNETSLVLAYSNITYDGTTFVSGGYKPVRVPASAITEVGDLVGVKPANSLKFESYRPVNSALPDLVESLKKIMTNFEANAHFGGGIIGSQGFILRNANLVTGQLAMEYDKVNRRLTSRVFEDLLCHQLPTLEDADVASEVVPTSPHGFQQTSSCMRCHSSIDGMAFGYRNLLVFASAPVPSPSQQVGTRVEGVTALAPAANATFFAVQPPVGRLHYRELITAKRQVATFSSLQQLGSLLAESQDLYTCAAKRYYRFLTGINVNLSAKATQEIEKYHQDQVLALGVSFKNHQSVRSLMYSIFNSNAFQSSHYLTESLK